MTQRASLSFALGLLLSSLIAMPQQAWADTAVTPRGQIEVKRMTVKLSDVFDGVPTEIDREIAQAPAPCKTMVYDVNVLTRLAQKYRLDWTAQSPSDRVVVGAGCTKITADAMKDAVIQKMKDDGIRGEIDIVFDNRALEIDLPADQSSYFSLNDFSYDAVAKRFSTDVITGGTTSYAIPISGKIAIKQTVPVLAHRLESGTTIAANDLDWIAVPEERVNSSVVQDADRLVGRELRHDLNGGEIIHSADVSPVRHVTRGSLVTLSIETPFMTLTAQGKALQDGTDGDVVRVNNPQSNRIIEGTVIGAGIVRVGINQIPQNNTPQKVALAQQASE